MNPVHILVDSFADEGLTNAQMINAQEIVSRLNSEEFLVTMFVHGPPAQPILCRPNTRLIQLPNRMQTIPLLARFLFGTQDILFYLKASPASHWFLNLRFLSRNPAVTVGMIESQTDWRDETITPQARQLIERTILRCDSLFSNSAFVQRSLRSNYRLASDVIPTGVDTDFFTPDKQRPPNSRPRVLFAGSLRQFKGPEVVLEAAQRCPQADFIIVGDGPLAGELCGRAKEIPNVTMSGSLGRTAIRDEYRRADVFLFPSRWEGSPRVLLEAAATGLPVIARKDYEPETVIHGKTGFLVTTDDDLMTRLQQLLATPGLRRDLGKAARAHMAQFSWDVIAPQWEAVFRRLAREQVAA